MADYLREPYFGPEQLVGALHDRDPRENQTQNSRGEWVPSIPLPFFGMLVWCGSCKRRFWTRRGYRGHYALVHVLGLE